MTVEELCEVVVKCILHITHRTSNSCCLELLNSRRVRAQCISEMFASNESLAELSKIRYESALQCSLFFRIESCRKLIKHVCLISIHCSLFMTLRSIFVELDECISMFQRTIFNIS